MAATVQVVALGMVQKNETLGLTLHLPYDTVSGQLEQLERFVELELAVDFQRQDFSGIPCYLATFGTDIDKADRVILQLMVQLYGYSPAARYFCEVYDEGSISKRFRAQAPPGGWSPPEE